MAIVTAVGATSWGTTLGIILAREGHDVRLLARTESEAAGLEAARENSRFVPGVPFPNSMHALADPVQAHDSADLTIFAVPSQTLRANARGVAHAIPNDTIVVSAVKGLELSSGKRMSQVTMIHDLDVRFRLMDEFGEYGQVISLPNPPLEDTTVPATGTLLAVFVPSPPQPADVSATTTARYKTRMTPSAVTNGQTDARAGIHFRATARPSWVSWACQTCRMPPPR